MPGSSLLTHSLSLSLWLLLGFPTCQPTSGANHYFVLAICSPVLSLITSTDRRARLQFVQGPCKSYDHVSIPLARIAYLDRLVWTKDDLGGLPA